MISKVLIEQRERCFTIQELLGSSDDDFTSFQAGIMDPLYIRIPPLQEYTGGSR